MNRHCARDLSALTSMSTRAKNAYAQPNRGPAMTGPLKAKTGQGTGKKKKQKAGQGAAGRNNSSRAIARPGHPVHTQVCTIANPFCDKAKGSLLPDNTPGARVALQFRGLGTLTTNATGGGCAAFRPFVGQSGLGYVFVAQPGLTGTFPADGGWVDYSIAILPSQVGSLYRIVSWGVIVRNISPANTAQGSCIMTTVNNILSSSTHSYDSLFGSKVRITPIAPGMEVSWMSTPLGPAARAFKAFDTDSLFNPGEQAQWTSLIVTATGSTATAPVLLCEYVVNVEILVNVDGFYAQLAQPSPQPKPALITAATAVTTTLGDTIAGGIREAEQAVGQAASRFLNNLVSNPFDALMGLV